VRKVSTAELLEIVQTGGTVSRQKEGYEQLVEQIRCLLTAQADISAQHHDCLISAVKGLTNALAEFKGGDIDTKPLEALVAKASAPHERTAYSFTVERNSRGLLTGMTATPAARTLN